MNEETINGGRSWLIALHAQYPTAYTLIKTFEKSGEEEKKSPKNQIFNIRPNDP